MSDIIYSKSEFVVGFMTVSFSFDLELLFDTVDKYSIAGVNSHKIFALGLLPFED
ncbi:unnamed protein product [Schistosoma margrebowiei]|uniref:Uncharacterized protein n=1 Tax=Schistosoma margrebowiei TaxID=48269 RepID=A0A183N392_9TREM|nr:unnamed protein product [Schistosoma margrebowiei]